MESTLRNMVTVLGAITLVASAAVGAVNMITAEPIRQAKEKALQKAMGEVLPEYSTIEDRESILDEIPTRTYIAYDGNSVVGYAVETASNSGFGGTVRIIVGFNPDGEVRNINVLEQAETPGLGTKMTEPDNPLLNSFKGKCPGDMVLKVKKDGGSVDALTAATISSRAYTEAVARAYQAFLVASKAQDAANAVGGATSEY